MKIDGLSVGATASAMRRNRAESAHEKSVHMGLVAVRFYSFVFSFFRAYSTSARESAVPIKRNSTATTQYQGEAYSPESAGGVSRTVDANTAGGVEI